MDINQRLFKRALAGEPKVAFVPSAPGGADPAAGGGGGGGGGTTLQYQTFRVVCASGFVQASQGVTNPTQNTFNSSVVRNSEGRYTVTLNPAFTVTNYEIFLQPEDTLNNNDDIQIQVEQGSRTMSTFRLLISHQDNGGSAGDAIDKDFSYQALCDRSLVTGGTRREFPFLLHLFREKRKKNKT